VAKAETGVGGLKYDASKRAWPAELNVFFALILIVAAFEVMGRLFNTRDNVNTLFNE
jgi:inositol transport system permease protein